MALITVLAVDRSSPLKDGEPAFETSAYTESTRGAFRLSVPENRSLSLEFLHGSTTPCALPIRLSPDEVLMLNIEVEPQQGEEMLLGES